MARFLKFTSLSASTPGSNSIRLIPKSAAAHANPRDAESLNDLSPFPPISNTNPTFSGSAAKTVEERHKLKITTNATTNNKFFFISEISFRFLKYLKSQFNFNENKKKIIYPPLFYLVFS